MGNKPLPVLHMHIMTHIWQDLEFNLGEIPPDQGMMFASNISGLSTADKSSWLKKLIRLQRIGG